MTRRIIVRKIERWLALQTTSMCANQRSNQSNALTLGRTIQFNIFCL